MRALSAGMALALDENEDVPDCLHESYGPEPQDLRIISCESPSVSKSLSAALDAVDTAPSVARAISPTDDIDAPAEFDPSPCLRVWTHGQDEYYLPFGTAPVVVGRRIGCTVVCEEEPRLSGEHLTFAEVDGRCYVWDHSTNGTYLNGRRLVREEGKPLRHGSRPNIDSEN